MKKNIKYLLITAAARHGKDSFANILGDMYKTQPTYSFISYAFADALKYYVENISIDMFGKTVFALDNKQKEIIRPILIAVGCAWREIDPLHWVRKVDDFINEGPDYNIQNQKNISVIKDCRFVNEIEYFKNKYGDSVFVLELIRENGPEPTDEEKKNIPLLKNLIDLSLTIPEFSGQDYMAGLKPIVEKFYSDHF